MVLLLLRRQINLKLISAFVFSFRSTKKMADRRLTQDEPGVENFNQQSLVGRVAYSGG